MPAPSPRDGLDAGASALARRVAILPCARSPRGLRESATARRVSPKRRPFAPVFTPLSGKSKGERREARGFPAAALCAEKPGFSGVFTCFLALLEGDPTLSGDRQKTLISNT